jgi:hypothetical protein
MKSIRKALSVATLFAVFSLISFHSFAQPHNADTSSNTTGSRKLFIDIHQLEPGKVKYEDVAKAHAKDLAVEGKYNVDFLKYWVDEKKGMVFCLASANDSESIRKTHAEAHGMIPQHVYEVTSGMESALKGNKNLFLDIHYLGAGVTASNVAAAHKKDLAVEKKYGVNFYNYLVDEKDGVVMCFAQAKDSASLVNTHKEAHGLIPADVFKVKAGK